MNFSNLSETLLLSLFYALIARKLHNNGVAAAHGVSPDFQQLRGISVTRNHRTAYHFQPPNHWINGPFYFNGFYHLFYQYNPKGAVWGPPIWAHSVSKDLVNWVSLEPAIYPSKPFDIKGCWSGSATILPGNRPVIIYTGIDAKERQLQNYAIPANLSDPYLTKWIKPEAHNPIAVPEHGVNSSAFRDPTTAWKANSHWHMLVGGKKDLRGLAYLYRSKDFIKWTRAEHPLHSMENSGMWECPDFYPVRVSGQNGLDVSELGPNVRHVVKVSLDLTRFDHYMIGTYFPDKGRYVPDNALIDRWAGLRYDYGNFYASKTFFDPVKKRRILWGWANESDTGKDDEKKGWAGIQAIPRTVLLDSSGKQLVQWPIEEVESLRGEKVEMRDVRLTLGALVEVRPVTAAQADVEVTFWIPSLEKAEPFDPKWRNAQDLCAQKGTPVQGGVGPFGLLTLASKGLEEFTPVFFRVFKAQHKYILLMCSDASSSSLRKQGLYKPSFAGFAEIDLADKKLSLRSLIDHSVVESFGAGGKTCILSRVYPTLALGGDAHLFLFNNGTQTVRAETLRAWSMKKPHHMNN